MVKSIELRSVLADSSPRKERDLGAERLCHAVAFFFALCAATGIVLMGTSLHYHNPLLGLGLGLSLGGGALTLFFWSRVSFSRSERP